MSKKYMFINLFSQFIAFGVSFVISFFITPKIIGVVGKETYGFLGLANSFAGYVTVITVALNALAGRFVTISIHRARHEEANEYFNSVMISNIIVAAVLIIPAIFFVLYLEKFLELPMHNVLDIKLTFAFVFLSFFINLICSIFSVATFATNKIYLASIRSIESNLLRIFVIVVAFMFFEPKISYVSGALLSANVFIAITNYRYTKKLLPEITLAKKYFSFSKVKELIVSGCWNSITALSNIMLEGLDLLICNIFIGTQAMGIVAIVKNVPSILYQVMTSIVSVFLPQLTIDYANNKKDKMVEYINFACKIVGMFMVIPVSFLIVFGRDFYGLWIPNENHNLLWILSILSLSELLFVGCVNIMYNLFHVTNRLKKPAYATLITGVLNTSIVLFLVNVIDLGVYAVVMVSSILGICRHLIFNIPYAARCIEMKASIFYKIALRSVLMVCVTCIIGVGMKLLFVVNGWAELIVCAGSLAVVSIIANIFIFYSKQEKKNLVFGVKNKIWRKKNDR